ncbi:Gpb2 protein [Saccharomycopsis crataegensis]|uniref:Gpb2 protein n=1 Tax=Saccharomycopsis crataegensis TaxID=43959 RepID=A0AAV5QFN6_9ASCO|nr:Gpb2 protein [Saccharomycopsis crataegensis]
MTFDSTNFQSFTPFLVPFDYFNHKTAKEGSDELKEELIKKEYFGEILKANVGFSTSPTDVSRNQQSSNESYIRQSKEISKLEDYYFHKLNFNDRLSTTSYFDQSVQSSCIADSFMNNSGAFSFNVSHKYIENERIWNARMHLDAFKNIIENIDINLDDKSQFPGDISMLNKNSELLKVDERNFSKSKHQKESSEAPASPEARRPSRESVKNNIELGELRPKQSFIDTHKYSSDAALPEVNTVPLMNDVTNISSMIDDPNIGLKNLNKVDEELAKAANPGAVTKKRVDMANQTRTREFKNNFINYSYCPTIYGKSPIPSLIHHTSLAIGNKVFMFGGVKLIFGEKLCDISTIKVKGPDYPFPFKNEVLNNPVYVNNDLLYVMDDETNIITTPKIFGDVPPALCCASATLISQRHIFYYGGFQITSKVAQPIDIDDQYDIDGNGTRYFERDFVVNNKAWILDTVTFKFQQIKLVPDENAALKVPIKLERFGHSTLASEMKFSKMIGMLTSSHMNFFDMNNKQSFQNIGSINKYTTSLYVFGGYSYNTSTKKFSCSNYNWKIDLSFVNDGTSNVLRFEEEGLYSCLESVNEGPTPRAFHASILLNEVQINGKTHHFAANSSMGIQNPEMDDSKINKVMMIHGGTNLSNLFGDFWKYTFGTKRWERIRARSNEFDENAAPTGEFIDCELHRANHSMIMLDQYLFFIGGFTEEYIRKELIKARLRYNSSNVTGYKNSWGHDAHEVAKQLVMISRGVYLRVIMMDLSTNTWIFAKCIHKLSSYVDYEEIFTNKENPLPLELFKRLRVAIDDSDREDFRKIVLSNRSYFDEATLKKLAFVWRTKGMVTNTMNLLGGCICFSEGKVYCIGGLLLGNDDDFDSSRENNSPEGSFSNFVLRGVPLTVIMTLVLPIFAQSSLSSYRSLVDKS